MLYEIRTHITSPQLLKDIILSHTKQNVSDATIDLILEHNIKKIWEFWQNETLVGVLLLCEFFGRKSLDGYCLRSDVNPFEKLWYIKRFLEGEGTVYICTHPTTKKVIRLAKLMGFKEEFRTDTSVSLKKEKL